MSRLGLASDLFSPVGDQFTTEAGSLGQVVKSGPEPLKDMIRSLEHDLITFDTGHQPLTLSNVQGLANTRRDYYSTLSADTRIISS